MKKKFSRKFPNLQYTFVIDIEQNPLSRRGLKVYSLLRIKIKVLLSLGLSINGLVTDGNTKFCCRCFILALFLSTTANKSDSEHTQDYKRLLPVCEAEILRVSVK